MADRPEDEGSLAGPSINDALVDLGRSIETGPVPDVLPTVLTRLAQPPPRRSRARRWIWGGSCAVVIAAVIGLTPGVAGAVGEFFGSLPGVLFSRSVQPPPPPPPAQAGPLGAALGLTAQVPLDEIRRVGTPVPTAVGDPAEAYRRGSVITMIWPAGPDLPAIGPSGIGLIVDVIDPSVGPLVQKMLPGPPEQLTIDGHRAIWVGEPHTLTLLDDDRGSVSMRSTRLSVRSLVVQLDPDTVRVESVLDKERAITIARSLR